MVTKRAAAIRIKAIAYDRKCRPPDVALRADMRRCRDREDLGRYRGVGTAEHIRVRRRVPGDLVACVFLWLAGLGGQRFSVGGVRAGVCDRRLVRGGQLEELRGPAEGLPDGVTRQVSLV